MFRKPFYSNWLFLLPDSFPSKDFAKSSLTMLSEPLLHSAEKHIYSLFQKIMYLYFSETDNHMLLKSIFNHFFPENHVFVLFWNRQSYDALWQLAWLPVHTIQIQNYKTQNRRNKKSFFWSMTIKQDHQRWISTVG